MSRQAYVHQVRIISVAYSSVAKVGDSASITPVANVFALQRRTANFSDDEGDLEKYPIFERKMEIPMIQSNRRVVLERDTMPGPLQVGRVQITGLSTSAVMQIGNTHEVSAESRTKHIRDYSFRC